VTIYFYGFFIFRRFPKNAKKTISFIMSVCLSVLADGETYGTYGIHSEEFS